MLGNQGEGKGCFYVTQVHMAQEHDRVRGGQIEPNFHDIIYE